ncbi:MAG: Mu-like prophage major head subunit gpT family protein [Paracoccaceae bacterium]
MREPRSLRIDIANRKFESTVGARRDDVSDDRLGLFEPGVAEMGRLAKQHPDELIFELLAGGFVETCYDGQPFFSEPHPSTDKAGAAITVSNVQTGAEPAWYPPDTSRGLKPLIWQEREPYEFQMLNNLQDVQVFMTDEFLYGVRARVNAGFGLRRLVFGSQAALDATDCAAARATMMGLRGDKGRLLGVRPDTLLVPPSLEEAGRKLLNSENGDAGATNPWKDTAKLIVSPYLDG